MKCIVNKLFIGALFLLGALVWSCQNTTENTVESSVEGKDTLGFKYIDIVHITHTDYGYTDHALIAVDLHKRFIDVALDLALKTKDEIPENRFAWTVESMLCLFIYTLMPIRNNGMRCLTGFLKICGLNWILKWVCNMM